MPEDNEMQKEWRAIVLSKLNTLEINQTNLAGTFSASISEIKSSFARQSVIDELSEKINKLESFRSKLIGAMIACQVFWAFITFMLYYLQGVHPH